MPEKTLLKVMKEPKKKDKPADKVKEVKPNPNAGAIAAAKRMEGIK